MDGSLIIGRLFDIRNREFRDGQFHDERVAGMLKRDLILCHLIICLSDQYHRSLVSGDEREDSKVSREYSSPLERSAPREASENPVIKEFSQPRQKYSPSP